MKEIQYRSFSLRTHRKNWQINSPSVCQFELTFRCGLHCKYCYTDCYNKLSYTKDELNTKEVCRRERQGYYDILRNKAIPKIIYKRGNTTFYKNPIGIKEAVNLRIDRLVFQPELPF